LTATFFERLHTSEATHFALRLISTIRALEEAAAEQVPDFKSPLQRLPPREWGLFASRLGPRSARCAELEHWYEALKLLVIR